MVKNEKIVFFILLKKKLHKITCGVFLKNKGLIKTLKIA